MGSSHPHQPSGLQVAVAVISAVLVLSGFSYHTSRIVGMVANRDVTAPKSQMATTPDASPALDAVHPVSMAYSESRGVDRRWFMPVEVVMTQSTTSHRLRGTAPQGRPLVLRTRGFLHAEHVVFESLDPPTVQVDPAGSACLPPLQRGAYPFAVVPSELDGMLLIE